MNPSKARGVRLDMNDRYLHQNALCPACEGDYLTTDVGALYGLHPKNYDDVFIFGLCKKCAHTATADEDNARRILLKNRLDKYIEDFSNDPFYGKLAVTTLKCMEIHNGVFANAIEIGWPFETPIDQCDVMSLPGGLVVVSTRETSDA